MDDRRPNFVTAIARMTGLSCGQTISTISIPFSRFGIILECHGQTNRRTELLHHYRPLQKLLLVLNCRDCRVFESNKYLFVLMQNLASCVFVTRVRTHPTPLVCLRHCCPVLVLTSTFVILSFREMPSILLCHL